MEELHLKTLLEANGLVVMTYASVYGHAHEVLTLDGKNRVAHGEKKLEVMRKAKEYLEAKAVLTGKPMRTQVMTSASDAADAMRYAIT